MGKYSKTQAISIITTCAQKYHAELEERTLLFLCIDKHHVIFPVEFTFHKYNFMHLTGCKTSQQSSQPITAIDFYERCLAHKLSPDDFDFAVDGTTQLKLDVLPTLLSKNLSAKIVGDYQSSHPKLYTEKLAGNVKACMGFVIGQDGNYLPNTVLKGDIRSTIQKQARVLAVYRKHLDDDCYTETTYLAKNVNWSEICYPIEYAYLAPEQH